MRSQTFPLFPQVPVYPRDVSGVLPVNMQIQVLEFESAWTQEEKEFVALVRQAVSFVVAAKTPVDVLLFPTQHPSSRFMGKFPGQGSAAIVVAFDIRDV